jgi:transcriptional regulator with XRE-family HTH domain
MSTIMEFANRVKDTREQLNASYEDIALFSNIAPERLALVEQGKDKSINALEITRLAFALGVTYEFLMFGKAN